MKMTKYYSFYTSPKIPNILVHGRGFELPPPDAQRARAELYHRRHIVEDKIQYSKHCTICLETGRNESRLA